MSSLCKSVIRMALDNNAMDMGDAIDELSVSFENAKDSKSVEGLLAVLKSERKDDSALVIKEQCIVRYFI